MSADPSTTAARPLVALGRVVDVVLLTLVVLGLVSVLLGRVLPALGYPVFVVAGPSMSPAIPMGAAVVLEQVPGSALVVDDVVSLRSGPERAIFTHRITRVVDRDGEPWIETKGDANPAADPSITPTSAVIGRVVASVPYGGYLLALLSTAPGVILMLSTGALLIVFGWWLDDRIADRRRTARLAGGSPPDDRVEQPMDPIPVLAVATEIVLPDPVTVRLDRDASARRRARHPLRTGDPARRRTARPRATGQGA